MRTDFLVLDQKKSSRFEFCRQIATKNGEITGKRSRSETSCHRHSARTRRTKFESDTAQLGCIGAVLANGSTTN